MNILDTIAAKRRERVAEKKEHQSLEDLQQQVQTSHLPGPPSFKAAILQDPAGCGLICELKKASPSRGLIAEHFDPVTIAQAYAHAGACAISCLCEPDWFQGSDAFLAAVTQVVSIPVLKKDFIIDPYMIYEARRDGASAILLIASLLSDAQLSDFIQLAHALHMEVLLEVHDAKEVQRALATDADVIGINNRDLKTFKTDLATFESLRPLIPAERCCIAESGIHTPQDLQRVCKAGACGALIGEACMEAENKQAFLQHLKAGLTTQKEQEKVPCCP